MPEQADAEIVCKDCKYFVRESVVSGICHRFPPLPHAQAVDMPRRPAVNPETDWCGEFKAKEQ